MRRWTTAFDTKAKKFASYSNAGVTSKNDACVVAISGAQLDLFPIPTGITQLPWVVETVFPVGPMQVTFRRDADAKVSRSERFEVLNQNRQPIPLYKFLDPAFAGISAVVGCVHRYVEEGSLPMQVVHNPLARVPLERGVFGDAAEEWVASPAADGISFELTRVP